MIALRDNLPLIAHENGLVATFDRHWLTHSLARAAAKAGYAHWWLADHVSQSVAEYLKNKRDGTVLPVDELNDAVKLALEGIGYSDVAAHFEPSRPRMHVSLVELAREAAISGYELAFFQKLRSLILEFVCERECDFEFRGLEASVRLLTACKAWTRQCERLQAEIIHFTRCQTELAAGQNEVNFALA